MKNQFKRKFIGIYAVFAGLLWLSGISLAQAQTCTPISATLLGSADDELEIWVNGNGPYPGSGPISYLTAGGPTGYTPISIPVASFNTTGTNTIAVLNQNLTASVVESSWVIQINCSSGDVQYITSADPTLKMYDSVDAGCASGPPAPAPPNDGGGNPWYSPSYSLSATYFTTTPTVVTNPAGVWLQPIYNPVTGLLQPWISVNNTGTDNSACEGLYYRDVVTINPQPFNPPNFTIIKSANPSTIAKSYSAGTITYKLIVCNSGAAVNTPVTIYDNLQYNIGAYYSGPTYNFSPPTQIFYNAGAGEYGSPTQFIFPDGFVGNNQCVTITYNMSMGDTMDAALTICNLINQASVTYNGVGAVGTAAVGIIGCSLAVNTSTSTNTETPTRTQTSTPTRTNTSTVTESQTSTSTPTNPNTPTNTQTETDTATVANTNTSTSTNTQTVTHTETNTITVSPTSTNTNTQTNTATILNTNTQTNTSTPTVTRTETNTITVSPTSTNTNTQTNTSTPLADTATNTNTPTNTNSITPSPTSTNTATSTDTLLDTATSTNTATNTVTLQDTATNTNTVTVTNSQTSTNTGTPTLVNTATNTQTSSSTSTSTSTTLDTFTATNTASSTSTRTSTSSVTNTQTSTNTATVTASQTSTITPASAVSMVKVASENQAQSGDSITYTITITVTGNLLNNPVVTDVLPANISFVAFGVSPSGTQTSNVNGTLTWILPSSLVPGTYTLTYTTKVNNFAPANVPLTNHAQMNYSGGTTLNAYAPITVIGNFSVGINIYNSAGEVVKNIPIQQFSTAITNINLSTNSITTLQGPGSTINILFNGYVIGTWNGTNNQGSPVGNGSYRIQIDNVSAGGTVTSVSQNAIVNRAIANVEVDIFNESGEVVRRLYNVMSNPVSSSMSNVTLSAHAFSPNLSAPVSAAGSNSSQLQIFIQDTSAPVTLLWDGSSDSGSFVSPGEYQIQVHWTDGNGNSTNITQTVLVLSTAGASGVVLAEPNVLKGGNPRTTINAIGVSGAASLKVKIYTMAGELVQVLTSPSPTVLWTPPGLASGLYIASVEVDNAGGELLSRQHLKILILH